MKNLFFAIDVSPAQPTNSTKFCQNVNRFALRRSRVSSATIRSVVLSKRRKDMLQRRRWNQCLRRGLCVAALFAMISPASAQTINTISTWDGSSNVSAWGASATGTLGELIVPTAGQTKLNSFTFELSQIGGTGPMQYQAFVYQFDNGVHAISGPALFSSAVLTAPASFPYTTVTINTGSLALTAGMQYMLFFTTTSVTQSSTASYQFAKTSSASYPAGTIYYAGSGQFSGLTTLPWAEAPGNLAFIAAFNSLPPVSPPVSPPVFSLPLFAPLLPQGAPINPTNVAAALDKFTNAGGTLPAGFLNLQSATPGALVAALSQLSGENGTDAQQGSFQLGNAYLSLLTDPFGSNRTGSGGALGFASAAADVNRGVLPDAITSAYASMPTKAASPEQPYWNSWGAAFGGSGTNRGDASVVGSHDSTASVGGIAAGADYHFLRDSLIGFSLAGGTTSWNLAGGFGGGSSQAFLGGIYGLHKSGAAYVSGALTYANYWMSTDRNVPVAGADDLQANFDAQSFGGRLEGGYRLLTWWTAGFTPYAAAQVQSFHTPAYSEFSAGGSSNQFALAFAARDATDLRSELGVRTDKTLQLADGATLSLQGRAAWAHDAVSDPQLSASFLGLTPIASFVVNGATPSHDLALLSGGAEWRFANGISLLAKFDGELSDRSMTYSGTGRLRYSW